MRVLVVGDSHGNIGWLDAVIYPLARMNKVDRIFQLGDFGWWPDKNTDLERDLEHEFVTVAKNSPVPMYWIDGNHEDHSAIAKFMQTAEVDDDGTYILSETLRYVPRGTMLEWDGAKIFAMGGAHSIDRSRRKIGVSYFYEEDISDEQIDAALEMGTADIMFTHDCPTGWHIPNLPSEDEMPVPWTYELKYCKENQLRLRKVFESVQPKLLVHGHLHSYYQHHGLGVWGKPFLAMGLNCDRTSYYLSAIILNLSPGKIVIEPLRGDEVSRPVTIGLG